MGCKCEKKEFSSTFASIISKRLNTLREKNKIVIANAQYISDNHIAKYKGAYEI